ncbi:MAG: PNGase F N-terminal domain-containing protein, partial [Bacteroidota bacterium]|nr:PNGase F N-terminal domain-containing protein [Bacteroidota bacterium]
NKHMKKSNIILLVIFLIATTTFSQTTKVVYHRYVNGEIDENRPCFELKYDGDFISVEEQQLNQNLISTVPEEMDFIDIKNKKYYSTALLNAKKRFTVISPLPVDTLFSYSDKTDTILGYICKHAKRVVFSNNIDFWFTDKVAPQGSPYLSLGNPGGLVLKIVINGSSVIEADKIVKEKESVVIPKSWGDTVSRTEYRSLIKENYIHRVSVFNDAQLSFGNEIHNPKNIDCDSIFHFSKGTVAIRKVTLPDLKDNTVFAELTEKSNGDAYDRTGSVFIIPVNGKTNLINALRDGLDKLPIITDNNGDEYQGIVKTDNYDPPTELIRFFTPFGVGHFNEKRVVKNVVWEDEVVYKQDVTDIISALDGDVWIGVYIANYDKGGHKVSMELQYHPDNKEKQKETKKMWSATLFNTLNIMEMSGQEYSRLFGNDTLEVTFEVPENIKDLQLRYISTGHGGWGGGDEFNKKLNTIIIDNKVVYSFIPWRTDCATFRKYNPASGNFWNGISSSDLSRSGWCPGSVSNPEYIILNDLKPGKHTLKVVIPMGKPEGNSFSAWNVSGVILGEME